MLGKDIVVVYAQCEIVRSVLGLTGVRAAHRNAGSKDHKADQDRKNLLRLVEAQNAPTCTKYGTVMTIHRDIAESVRGLPGVFATRKSADNKDHKADQDRENLLRLVEAQNALTCTKHGSVMPMNELIAN